MIKFETIFKEITNGFKIGLFSITLALKNLKLVIITFLSFMPFIGVLFSIDYIKSELLIVEKLNPLTKITLFLLATIVLVPCLMFGIAFTFYCARNILQNKKEKIGQSLQEAFLYLKSLSLFSLTFVSFILPYIFSFFLKPLIGTITEGFLVSIFLAWQLVVSFAIPLIIENKNIQPIQTIKDSFFCIKNNFFKILGGWLFTALLEIGLFFSYLLFGYLSAILTIGLSKISNIELIMTTGNIFAGTFIFIFLFIHMLIWATMIFGGTIFVTLLNQKIRRVKDAHMQ